MSQTISSSLDVYSDCHVSLIVNTRKARQLRPESELCVPNNWGSSAMAGFKSHAAVIISGTYIDFFHEVTWLMVRAYLRGQTDKSDYK